MPTSQEHLADAQLWLLITTLIYFLMNGAQIFETAVIVPKWTASPPDSLQMFKGKYSLDFKVFWIVLHSIHEISFITAIYFCWQLPIREFLVLLFCIHFAVRIWTLIYFAPTIISVQKCANGIGKMDNINVKVALWRKLNYIRVLLFIGVSIGVIGVYLRLI